MIIPNYAPNEEAELVIPTQVCLIPRPMDLTTTLVDDESKRNQQMSL